MAPFSIILVGEFCVTIYNQPKVVNLKLIFESIGYLRQFRGKTRGDLAIFSRPCRDWLSGSFCTFAQLPDTTLSVGNHEHEGRAHPCVHPIQYAL